MLFESNPWILVPLVVAIVEAWGAAKGLSQDLYRAWRNHQSLVRS